VENLARWCALYDACSGLRSLRGYLLATLVSFIEDPAERGNAAQIDKAKKIFTFFCSFHSMALVVVMQYFGKAFKTFHEALQERKNDFSRKTRELRILKNTVLRALDPECQKQLLQETEQLVFGCMGDESISDMQDELDVEVRVEDADPVLIAEVLEELTRLFVEQFQDSQEVRFPENREMTVQEAFEILNPESFPPLDLPEMKDFEAQLSTFGDDQLKVLLSWYGEPKNRAGTIFPPLVDSNLCTNQWIGFREHLFSWYSAKKVSSVPSLARKVRVWLGKFARRRGRAHASRASFLRLLSLCRLPTFVRTRRLSASA